MEQFNIKDLISSRANQQSFHVVSEKNVRVEFRNMRAGETLEGFRYDGNVILTCYRGTFALEEENKRVMLQEMDQAVIPVSALMVIECLQEGTLQIIWSPPFAQIVKG
jgi:hypothetical protein